MWEWIPARSWNDTTTMPELPEVETVRAQLAASIIGEIISEIAVSSPIVVSGDTTSLGGKEIIGVDRFSKLLVLRLTDAISIAIHLKMTGRVLIDNPDDANNRSAWDETYASSRHTHVTMSFASGKKLLFYDTRRFGRWLIGSDTVINQLPYIQSLGPEFLSSLTEAEFVHRIRASKRAVKVLLLDQHVAAGVGNIYANEGLWRAGIHPETPGGRLTELQAKLLFAGVSESMQDAIVRGGASSDDFRDTQGKPGKAQHMFSVYGRTGQPCPRCGTLITKLIIAGRGTYICKACQSLD